MTTCHKRSTRKTGFKVSKEQREELIQLWKINRRTVEVDESLVEWIAGGERR